MNTYYFQVSKHEFDTKVKIITKHLSKTNTCFMQIAIDTETLDIYLRTTNDEVLKIIYENYEIKLKEPPKSSPLKIGYTGNKKLFC